MTGTFALKAPPTPSAVIVQVKRQGEPSVPTRWCRWARFRPLHARLWPIREKSNVCLTAG
ncbi:MAG TPA: hypothetical protein VN522_09030 [Solirubrobacterales bacterium]|nr:hypothetical protein [Solirubrobacterales bacterium]